MKKYFLPALFIFITIIVFAFSLYLYPSLRIATGYAAKYTCSYTYLAGMEYEKIKSTFNFFPVDRVTCEIDRSQKSVSASLFGMAPRTAYYYEKGKICGCVLDSVEFINRLLEKNFTEGNITTTPTFDFSDTIPDSVMSNIDLEKLNTALAFAIDSNSSTLAVTVAYKNFLVAEKYATGVNKDTRLLGWSMTKTMSNALFGILEKNKIFELEEHCNLPQWQDQRSEITLNHLLQMSSGLEWNEEYSMKTDVTDMLYLNADIPAYAGSKPMIKKPGEHWYYSSGTSNILSGIIRRKFNDDRQYINFPFDSLFHPIGMNSAVVEMDNSGNYILSSYGWATARDWTKFGLLYLNKGNLSGKQIFTSEWAAYSVMPASGSNNGYASQIWLNGSERKINSVPDDGYFFNGYGGQKILVLPSKNLVVVILSGRQKDFDFNRFYEKLFACIK